jgi:formate dehydrogenase subunit delta
MSPEKLVYMANQIATFFASQPKHEQVEAVAQHLHDFWDPRMRRQLFEIVDAGGEGLAPLVVEATARLERAVSDPVPIEATDARAPNPRQAWLHPEEIDKT